MAVGWSRSTTANSCDPWRSEEQPPMRVEGGRTSGMDDDFGGSVPFWDIGDALAAFASKTTVSPDQSLSLSLLFGSFLPPFVAAITARENRDEEGSGSRESDGSGCPLDPRAKESSIVVVEDHQRVLLRLDRHCCATGFVVEFACAFI